VSEMCTFMRTYFPPNVCGQRTDGWARLLPPAKGVNTRRVRCNALLGGAANACEFSPYLPLGCLKLIHVRLEFLIVVMLPHFPVLSKRLGRHV
jgi:hypothetical protein